ncbi:MAG: FIG00687303: hypothetical protein, partial [uncultured Acetobacteraceae bacterium]
ERRPRSRPLRRRRLHGADHGPLRRQRVRPGGDDQGLPHAGARQRLRPALRARQPGAVPRGGHVGRRGDRGVVRLRRRCRGDGRRRGRVAQRTGAARLRRTAGARRGGAELARPRPAPRRGRRRRGGGV